MIELTCTYTVQPADEAEGLLGIARRLYGDPCRWPEIYEANQVVIGNNPTAVWAGQQLRILGLDCAPHGQARIYVVQPADVHGGLMGIAGQLCGDPERWREVYAFNKGVIGDSPDHLQAGQRLIIPS
jgi:nucleoid-associated protein YgaU